MEIETLPVPLPWPPRCFDFDAPILRASNLHFERNADAETALIRRVGRLRIVIDLDRIDSFTPIIRGSRDFRLLRLVPEALRFVEQVAPFDPLPPELFPAAPPLAAEPYLRAATARLLRVIAAQVEKAGMVFGDALTTPRDHSHIFLRAARRTANAPGTEDHVDPIGARLHQLAHAHAGVLAAYAEQPDFAGMALRVAQLRRRLAAGNSQCPDVLLHQALTAVHDLVHIPGRTADRIASRAEAELWRPNALQDISRQLRRQQHTEAKLREIALFWRRTCQEWLNERPDRPNWRRIETLSRTTHRRLSAKIYDDECPED